MVSGIEREDVSAPRIRPPPTTFRVIGKENSVVPFYEFEEFNEDREEIPEEYPDEDIGQGGEWGKYMAAEEGVSEDTHRHRLNEKYIEVKAQ